MEVPRFQDNQHIKEVSSAQNVGLLYTSGNILGIYFCWRPKGPYGHSAAEWIMSIKNSSDKSGIEQATFRLVAQYLNKLRHHVPAYISAY